MERTYRILNDLGDPEVVSWHLLSEVNDPETMDEIGMLSVGETTVLGMCDEITRLT